MENTLKLPHDIRGLLPYPESMLVDIILGIVVGLVMAGVIYFLFKKYLNKQSQKKLQEQPAVNPVDDLFWRIEKLSPPSPFNDEQRRDYFYRLSLHLREAMELGLGIPATDMTLKEIKQRFPRAKSRLEDEDLNEVYAFLNHADMVKFAGEQATFDQAKHYHEKLKTWFLKLKPRPMVDQEVMR